MLTLSYNSMGLPAKLTSNQLSDLVNGATDVGVANNAVTYDAAGRLTALRMPAGGSLWQTRSYFNWTATNASYPGDGNGRLDEIHIGTTSSNWDRLRLEYDYDSYGNVKRLTENGTANSFTYNTQSQVTAAYSKVYANDALGRLSNYEGTSPTLNTTFPAYMPKFTGYTFDANGNATARPGQTLVWDVQNRLKEVKNGSTVIESYLYNPDGQRVKKTAGSTSTYYVSPFYEVSGSTVTKYYFFGGQRIAMKRGTTLTYLHSDHLGSTVLETNSAGSTTTSQTYCAYGRKRTISGGITTCGTGNSLTTDQTFTGQKLDGSGLQYYNSRYYDPAVGVFVSPDSIVPDATSVFDYNRFMFVVGNPLKFNDPTGHIYDPSDATGGMIGPVNWAGAARSTIQLSVDVATKAASTAIVAEGFRESVPLQQPTKAEATSYPLSDPLEGYDSWISAPTLPSQQVWADPLAETPSAEQLIVDINIGPRWSARSVGDPACSSGCERVATQIQKMIGGDRYRLTPEVRGGSIGGIDGVSSGWFYHEVVIKDGRVYDLLTGYLGQALAEYRSRYQEDDGIIWEQISD